MTRARALRLAGIIAVFLVVGPIIGLAMFAIGAGVVGGLLHDMGSGPSLTLFILIYGAVFAHYFGLLPALAAGAVAAGYSFWRGALPWWMGVVTGLAGAAMLPWAPSLASMTSFAWRDFLIVIVDGVATCVAAAVACTWLTRRWQ